MTKGRGYLVTSDDKLRGGEGEDKRELVVAIHWSQLLGVARSRGIERAKFIQDVINFVQ